MAAEAGVWLGWVTGELQADVPLLCEQTVTLLTSFSLVLDPVTPLSKALGISKKMYVLLLKCGELAFLVFSVSRLKQNTCLEKQVKPR